MVANSGTPKIRPIDRAAVHRICSGQVVLDLATAVKELVENSLDAGATNVEIRLKEYGSALIEVADNGSGVSPDNYEGLTLKYYTSKISEFADLQTLSSFGFRGEALSSLCALSNVSVTTRTKEEAVGTRLEYDHSGVITLQESVARAVGTTVAVSKLFSPLPVRYKEFNRNIRREYGRLLSVLQAYALIAKGVRIVCTNQVGKSGRTTIVQTQGSNSVKDNIITIFGSKTAACLEPLVLSVSDDCRLEGFVSRPGAGCGRASGDRQFCYVNGRPVDLPKINRLLNELYGSFNSLQKPMAVLNFLLSPTAYDVNVTPDKRKVFLHMESDFLVALKEALEKVYTPDNYSYTINSLDPNCKSLKGRAGAVELEAENLHITSSEYIQELDTSAEINDSEETEGSPTQDKALTPGPFLTFEQNTPLKSGFLDLVSFKLKGAGSTRNGKGKLATAGGHSSSRDATARSNPPKILQSQLTRFVMPSKRMDRTEESNEVAAVWDNVEVKKLDIVKHSQEESSPVEASAEDIISLVEIPQDRSVSCAAAADDDDESHPAPVIIKPKLVIGLDQEESLVETPQDRAVSCADDESHPAPVINKPKLVIGLDQEESCTIKVPEEGILTNDMDMQHFPVELEEDDDDVTPMDIEKSMDERVNKDCTVGVPSSSQINPAVLPFDLQKLQGKAKRRLVQCGDESMKPKKDSKRMRGFNAATLGADGMIKDGAEKEAALIAATKELELSFSKSDFRHMKVIGQFNLGFILARLDQDLFIVDQHASDEKYNFERLSKTTVLNKQPLIRPLLVDLSAAEEIIVTTHIETFRQNGFDFVEEDNAPPGRRLRLSTVPFSKNITFGVGDVQELVGILANESAPIARESPGSLRRCNQLLSVVRPSRVRSMLASRACRSSIMIGDSLSKKEMEKVLCHLTDLDAPWNCPHGRPTMRHLADLTGLHQR